MLCPGEKLGQESVHQPIERNHWMQQQNLLRYVGLDRISIEYCWGVTRAIPGLGWHPETFSQSVALADKSSKV